MTTYREIPFNYTSADDRRAVSWMLGDEVWRSLEELRARRVTGRSARLLMRIFGEILVHRRNPFLYRELTDDPVRRHRLFRALDADLRIIEENAGREERVAAVTRACRKLLDEFRVEIAGRPRERRRIALALAPIVGRENVLFDPFTLVCHATDATDWRLCLPIAVVTPTEEHQVSPLLSAIEKLGLYAIPRGAGTGLTGGAIPLRPGCVMVNTERLDRIGGIQEKAFVQADGRRVSAPVMSLEAGVITEHAMEVAQARGLVFATDPTSAWASTIGGNIAENAGGKTAVLWGTCIDNLLAYRMAMPGGKRYTIRRTDHALRKVLPEDTLTWEIRDPDGALQRTVSLRGSEIRHGGLWKDITNKALKGLPGVQKEGTDGIITSAEFILYREYEARATLCLEFFGPGMDEASRVILELVRSFPNRGAEVLQALEHFDHEYVRAIGYKVKAPRAETPKAVLLIDIVGHSADEVARGLGRIREILSRHGQTHLCEARDEAEAKLFWADRKRLGAIASRTNAFKLNEDIVLPLEALAEFARFCDTVNLEEEREAQRQFLTRARELLAHAPPQADAPWFAEKATVAAGACERALESLKNADENALRGLAVTRALQEKIADVVRGYEPLLAEIEALHAEERRRRIVIATHMHAGDGNVHVNIPVLSNDLAMMRRAEQTVDRVMEKVAVLGGVCSGEHGIGVTKLQYLAPEFIDALDAYRREVDPRGTMNPGKLSDRAALNHIYTPSFNLLELEARILQHGKLGELAKQIANCVRCGKCKPDCCVFHPPRGLFYHPRNKNLAIGALIEALLYESQRERSANFKMLRYLEDVADHCTICHKCAKPCPVAIDTGDVSVLERSILAAHGFKHTALATQMTLRYLESRSPIVNAIFRAGVVRLGGMVQRVMAGLARPIRNSVNAPYPIQMLRSTVPPGDPRTLRDVLPRCEAGQVLLFEPEGEARETVFYFPGCGSERLFANVSMAALHVLIERGTRIVIPPPYLCCGFPHHANAQVARHDRIVLRDSIIFTQIREMFSYLTFQALVVTCGTCRESLGHSEAGSIFDAPILDVAVYAAQQGLKLPGGGNYLYHAPCHDSMQGTAAATLKSMGDVRLQPVPHCCSEAGTLALSRPDISHAMLHRKRVAIEEGLKETAAGQVMLTNCPSCLQGLGRHGSLVCPRHIAVEMARLLSGDDWLTRFRQQAARAIPIRF